MPSEATLAPVPRPVDLRDDMTAGQQAAAWGDDRTHLVQCRWRHAISVEWIRGVAEVLRGASDDR
ncbi:UNVERIFIED_CONTAM: hypothetical protein BEN50_19120 [Euhalothece sp. KZN 001]